MVQNSVIYDNGMIWDLGDRLLDIAVGFFIGLAGGFALLAVHLMLTF